MELKDILEQLEKFVQETMNNSMKENKNQLDYEEGNKLIDMLQKKEVKLMSELEVNIPFADIISVIITLEKGEHYKEVSMIVKDIVRSYSGDYNMLEEDIGNLFTTEHDKPTAISVMWPEEYKILKKVFGGLIWSGD